MESLESLESLHHDLIHTALAALAALAALPPALCEGSWFKHLATSFRSASSVPWPNLGAVSTPINWSIASHTSQAYHSIYPKPISKKKCVYIYINNIYNIHQTITITTFQTADTEKNTIARSTGGGRQARVPSTSRAHEFFAHGKAMLHDAAPLSKGKISLEMMKPNREIFAD